MLERGPRHSPPPPDPPSEGLALILGNSDADAQHPPDAVPEPDVD
jgi:hypothetical protein